MLFEISLTWLIITFLVKKAIKFEIIVIFYVKLTNNLRFLRILYHYFYDWIAPNITIAKPITIAGISKKWKINPTAKITKSNPRILIVKMPNFHRIHRNNNVSSIPNIQKTSLT